MTWVPLHVHSQYSILDSSASVKALAKRAAKEGMPALALTDYGNMFGAVEFFKACKAEGVKPIIGLEIAMAPESRLDKKRIFGKSAGYPIVLLAKNEVGYRNLCKLTSIGYLEGFYYSPRIDKEALKEHSEGLICLSGSLYGPVASGEMQIEWFHNLFGDDFFLELQRHEMSEEQISADGMDKEPWRLKLYQDTIAKQKEVEERLVKAGLPLVATNDTHYLDRGDWQGHEILKNVQSGEPCEIWEKDSFGRNLRRIPNPKRKVEPTHELYFRSVAEIEERFRDLPEALENSVKIAERCNFEMNFDARFYPVFEPPESATPEDYLRQLCEEGIKKRYTEARLKKVGEKYPDRDPMDVVKERLEYELGVIYSKGMCDYLLIVYDFIAWAKGQKIPVGPGRGSGAGSIILYLIGITDIEPLRFNLFFERFINPERPSYPDIDVDICMERRGEVIDYTINKYGKDKVAQIITFGTMKAKMAVKDVGRVLSVPLTKVNAIAKLIPEDLGMTLERALEIDADLQKMYETDEETKRVIDLALGLEGSIRNTGIHAAGLIICADPLTDHIPVCNAKDVDMVVTQYSMKPVEAVGMLKIDFLGLKTLTSIQKTVDAVDADIDIVNLPLDDKPTFDLLNHGQTLGVFQLESGGMQDLAKNLHIDKFEEIIAVGALYRPGPMEMIPTFINRKHKREPIEYDHEWMKDVLEETYGIMVYQEQVMQIASLLAGYTLGEGDVLRRAMGKKDHDEMMRQRDKFRSGALEKGIPEELSMQIFDQIEKFASYGFNKSHAAAYGFLSYVTAYLKANYPRQWMAALMTCDMDDITKVAKHIREAQSMGIEILSADVNESHLAFAGNEKGIRFAMSGIKGVGHGAQEAIVEAREESGPYESFYDFLKRADLSRVNKKAVLHLIDAGGFDFTGWTRLQLRDSLDTMYEMAVREQKEKKKGVLDLFASSEESQFISPPKDLGEAPKQEILAREKELLGFYLSGHPMDDFEGQLQKLSAVPLETIKSAPGGSVFRAAAIIDTVQVRISQKSQRKFAILNVSDKTDRFELPIWPDLFEIKSHLLLENQLIYTVVSVENRDGETSIQCRWLDDLTAASEQMVKACDAAYDHAKQMASRDSWRKSEKKSSAPAKEKKPVKKEEKVEIELSADAMRLSHILELKKIFTDHAGPTPLDLHFISGKNKIGTVEIDSNWGVKYDPELVEKLKKLPFFQGVVS